MDTRPIGVFDSGLGGLTAVKELLKILPNEQILYFGDTGRVPYGNRSKETLLRYVHQDVRFLLSHHVKFVLAACGTASSVAGELELPVHYANVLAPTARAAAKATKNKRVGVIGTAATIASGSYRRELMKIDPDLTVFEQACPLFVPLVENGFIAQDEPITRLVAERYLLSLKERQVDTLILGCTHYPIISRVIADVMGREVTLIDSGREGALRCAEILRENDLLCAGTQPAQNHFYVSDRTEGFAQIAQIFLGREIADDVQRIDIERY